MQADMATRIGQELADIVGHDAVLTQEHEVALYSYDATLTTCRPDVVVLPQTTEQVSQVVKLAHACAVPVTARGGGTCLSGGPVPTMGGIVLALTRMDRILEIDVPGRRAVVQPGVINMDLSVALDRCGYLYAPDPASQVACTMGGNIAENAGGPRCLKYGVTTNHVTGLEMVLGDGTILRTGSKAMDGPGYDLAGVITGSEGTLGIVTEITCRILPKPQAVTTMLAVFDELDCAGQSVSDIIASGLLPAALEMIDKPLIGAVQMAFDAGYPQSAQAVLIVELDGLSAGMQRQLSQIQQMCQDNGVQKFEWADTEAKRELLWRGRKGTTAAIANISPSKLSTDVTVPRAELAQVLAKVVALGAQRGMVVGNVFHAGDGNLHPQILFDARDPGQLAVAAEIDDEIVKLAVSHGGVLTGEHGIGSCKRKWMHLMHSVSDLRAQWAIKKTFDPIGNMNPSKVLPDEESLAPPKRWKLPHGPWHSVAPRLAPVDGDGTCHPYDTEAVSKLMALAEREGQPLAIRGSGSQCTAATPHPTIRTRGLSNIVSLDAQNLTVTVGAGTLWEELQQQVARVGQFVPLRPGDPQRMTVGGVIATNATGPHRLLYGACKDLVIGTTFVLPGGEVINSGSRCVKNVSGLAIGRLLVGSHGSLGVITEATLRTRALPEDKCTLCLSQVSDAAPSDRQALGTFASEALLGHLSPAALEVLTPCVAKAAAHAVGESLQTPTEGWCVAVGLEGLREEVTYQRREFEQLAEKHGLSVSATLAADSYEAFWRRVTHADAPAARVACPVDRSLHLARSVVELHGWSVYLRLGLGTGVGVCSALQKQEGARDEFLAGLAALASQFEGWTCWLPPAGNSLVVGDDVRARLCQKVKDAWDPLGLLAPLGTASEV